jgi:hypothetical protein
VPADPKTLYTVTIFVFAALTVWLLAVLRTSKESWARPVPQAPLPLKVLASTEAEDPKASDESVETPPSV